MFERHCQLRNNQAIKMLLVACLGIISILMGGLRTILPGEIINRSDKDLQDQRPHITCPVPNGEDVGY